MVRVIVILTTVIALLTTDAVAAQISSHDSCRIAANPGRSSKRPFRLRAARAYNPAGQAVWIDSATEEADPPDEPVVLAPDDDALTRPAGEMEVWPQASALFPANEIAVPVAQ